MGTAHMVGGNKCDRFGHPLDPTVGYARGAVITDEVAESLRQARAYGIIRDRYARYGDDGVYNLTGLIRAFPFAPGDGDAMRSYVHFIARSRGEFEALAIEHLGGRRETHDGFLATRITAAMLAIMLALLKPGERVLSLVARDRSHPSVKQGVTLARAEFEEAVGIDAFAEALGRDPAPSLVVITTISPSKHHLPLADLTRAIGAARARGALVLLDDAHMASRLALYDEPAALAIDPAPDVTVWSLDKHMGGPRSGLVAGNRDLIKRIKARALGLGVEAQLGQIIAGYRAVEAFDPRPVREAGESAKRILAALGNATHGLGYLAGAGVAVGGEDYLGIALARAGCERTSLVPIEAVAFGSMTILERMGAVTIPAVGMPGASCTFRLMTYPDGARLGERGVIDAWNMAIEATTAALDDPERVRATLLG
ncbi:MAG: aminotransferase class I/II-fold pyridoxal phosphate-dependent enzyme [Rhodospirillales bacterium]|nr:aminotransferase class I/II-fold pyridoxal phosphate-dependent enzyme [Rhodospirillales bacterium]